MISFKEWLKLKEVATTTASVATYAMPLGASPIKRSNIFGLGGYPKKKKHKKKGQQ